MRITINNGLLAHELRLLNKITPTNPTLAALGYVLFKVDNGRLTLSATDLEVMLTVGCDAKTEGDGQLMLPTKTLLDLVERLVNVDVVIQEDRSHVGITAGAFKSRLSTARPEDFPTLPQSAGAHISLPAEPLGFLINRVRYAVPEKPQTYTLQGALLILNPTLGLVAVDGKRLSLATDGYTHVEPFEGVVLPTKTLDILEAYCDGAQQVEFSQSDRHLFFHIADRVLVSRTIDGKFPNYKPIIPQDVPITIDVARVALAAALRRVGVLSEESQAVDFAFGPDLLRLTSSSVSGEAAEELVIAYQGQPMKLCANGKFVLEFLEHAIGSGITVGLRNDASPMLLKDGDKFLNVVTILKP